MEEEYTNRELDAKFEGIHEKLDLILAQTTKTNGRVTTLEFWRESLMAKIAGVVATFGIVWMAFKTFVLNK